VAGSAIVAAGFHLRRHALFWAAGAWCPLAPNPLAAEPADVAAGFSLRRPALFQARGACKRHPPTLRAKARDYDPRLRARNYKAATTTCDYDCHPDYPAVVES